MDDVEIKKRFGSQITKYLGGVDRAKTFVSECEGIGLDLRDAQILKNVSENPEWFAVMLSYSELGLLKRINEALTNLKENKNGNEN